MSVEREAARVCQNCESAVPAGAEHCPICCGADGQLGVAKRRAVIGALVGLMAGGIAAAVVSSFIGPEGSWGLVIGIALGGSATGLLVGAFGKEKSD